MDKYLKNYPPVLDVSSVACILGITNRTVRKLIKRGDLIAIKVGRLFRIPKSNLIVYLENNIERSK